MRKINKAIGDYLSLSQDTKKAIEVIDDFFANGRIPAQCHQKPLAFLKDLQGSWYSLDQQIAIANYAFENMACDTIEEACHCFEAKRVEAVFFVLNQQEPV